MADDKSDARGGSFLCTVQQRVVFYKGLITHEELRVVRKYDLPYQTPYRLSCAVLLAEVGSGFSE